MKCLVIGICQLEAVGRILTNLPYFRRFFDEVEVRLLPSVTSEEMHEIVDVRLQEYNLIITHPMKNYRRNPVFTTKYLQERIAALPVSQRPCHILVPVCYFNAYEPIPFQAIDEHGEIIFPGDVHYFPGQVLLPLLEGDIAIACKNWKDHEAFTYEEVQNNLALTFQELEAREEEWENSKIVLVSRILHGHYRRHNLFHTFNHPTNILLFHIVEEILLHIRLVSEEELHLETLFPEELLGDDCIPPSAAVHYHLDLEFIPEKEFTINGEKLSLEQAMQVYSSALLKEKEYLSIWKDIYAQKLSRLSAHLLPFEIHDPIPTRQHIKILFFGIAELSKTFHILCAYIRHLTRDQEFEPTFSFASDISSLDEINTSMVSMVSMNTSMDDVINLFIVGHPSLSILTQVVEKYSDDIATFYIPFDDKILASQNPILQKFNGIILRSPFYLHRLDGCACFHTFDFRLLSSKKWGHPKITEVVYEDYSAWIESWRNLSPGKYQNSSDAEASSLEEFFSSLL